MEHYLDNAATTKPSDAAIEAISRAVGVWGNPSSTHRTGLDAASLLKESRQEIAKTLSLPKFTQDRIIFTSSGTEANNLVLFGCAGAKKRDPERPGTIIISDGEHPSIDESAKRLEGMGYAVVRIPTLYGRLDLNVLGAALENAKRESRPVIISSFMLVNNETGAVYDVKSASALVKKYFPDAIAHTDAVQGYLKMKFTPQSLGVDCLSVSSHKIHSIRGAGALYVSAEVIKRKNLTATTMGGGQEGGLRSGTENLVSIAAFAAAAREGFASLAANTARVAALRERLDAGVLTLGLKKNLPEKHSDTILNVLLPDIKSEVMLNFLSAKGIYVSAGSACSAYSKKKSSALSAFGVDASKLDCAIRISLSHTNTEDDIDALIAGLGEGISTLQRKRG